MHGNYGSVTAFNAKMKDVHCSPIQRMVFKKADYGDFNNNGTFDITAEIDRKCSILTNCQLKSHCGGSRSCELTIDNNLLPSQYCSDISKEIYTDYICVDTYISLNLKGPNVRFSESPTKGFIQIKDGSTWRKVDEENWDMIRHKMLCRYLGFSEADDHNIGTRNVGSGENIATGDLICYNTQPNGTSCCVNLQRNTTTSIVNLPYAICKICDNPLLQNVTTFPDSVFSGSGSSNFKDARFSGNGWCAAGSGNNYILLDLQKEYHIAQIVVMGNENQTTWSDSYSLKFSHNKTLVDGSSAIQIKGNQNGYQASVTIVDIYNVRYLKIESTKKTEFCLRTELCGEVQLPAPVENITTKSSNFSVDLSWTILGPRQSSYITHFIIYLNGIQLQRISREKYGTHYILYGLTSYTDYVVGVQAQDGSSYRSVIAYESFKTEEAVPSGPPWDVNFESRGKNSLKVSWKAPDKRLWHGELTGYQVCYSTLESDKNPKCSRTTAFLYTIYNLHPSTEYFVTVSAGTKVGYGNNSLEISQITNGEPMNPFATSYYTLSLNIPKPAEYIKGVMVIVHNATGSSIPSANFQTNNLGPFQENIQDLYITAYLKADVLPLTFVIGDGKEYNSEKQKYSNQPLKQKSGYIVFLRFFESNDSYYSTEWSSSVKTMVKPPEEYIESRSTEQSTGDKTLMELLIPLVIVCLGFLLSLCVNIYQRRLIQNNSRHARHKSQTSKQAYRTQNLDSKSMKSFEGAQKGSYVNDDTLYETPDEVLESVERNCTGSRPDNSTGQEPSTYMSLKDNQEPGNFYQPLQAPGASARPDHTKGGDQRVQTMQYENLAFKANFSGE